MRFLVFLLSSVLVFPLCETARELRAVVEEEFDRLEQEAETLAIGAPTTVSATLDAILHVVESAEQKLKKLTGKIHLSRS
ncbi:MAG: hypothetical protein P1U85_07045 [Verrucomicrobiales bacterium]|jgi:hypothetical protein|nr:hypothetical protein [Verrucomicrobiales bacterium]